MNKKDLYLVTAIGGLVGLLSQPVFANVATQFEAATALPAGFMRLGIFVFFLVLAPLALWVAHILSKLVPVVYQFAKFAAVGSLNSFVDLGIFNVLTLVFGLPAQGSAVYALFKALSFTSATTNSYLWNRNWTFEAKSNANVGEATKFYSIAIISGLLNVGIATLTYNLHPEAVDIEVWGNIVAPIVGILCSFIFNFLGYKFIVFKKVVMPATPQA